MGVEEGFQGTLAAEGQDLSQVSGIDDRRTFQPDNKSKDGDGGNNANLTEYDLQSNEISYQYLTFQTEVATQPIWPNVVPLKDAPEIPNYRKYDDPFSWSLTRKHWMTYLACSVNAVAAYAAGSYESPADTLTAKWHISGVVYNIGITVFTAGFGIAPMALAPFSEINGRRPVFIVSGILFVICQMCCALTRSFGGMLASRFFLGVGGSTFSTMVGGILADIWITADRNTPMVLFTGATLFGTGLGPLVSGFVAQRLDWRWVFYIQIMTSGTLVALVTIFFKETRGSVLLSRKAKTLNTYYEQLEAAGASGVLIPEAEISLVSTGASTPPAPTNDHVKPPTDTTTSPIPNKPLRLRYRVKSDEERATLLSMISLSLYRPLHMLITEPVVFWFSLWISFSWAILYLQFGSIPLVFRTNHNFTLEQTGLVFISMCVGAILSTLLSIYQEKWGMRYHPQRIGGSPEGRLYFACIESAFMPIGLFMFGWSCYSSVHWIVPTIAIGIETMGIFSIFLAVFNYSADVYRIYASSALAASGLCRNLLGGSFPLVTVQMFQGLGFQAASSLLGGIGAALTLVPWVLVFFGPRIRKASRIASQFVEEDAKTKETEQEQKGRDEEETSSGVASEQEKQ